MATGKIIARLKNATPIAVASPTSASVTDFFRECCRAVPYVLRAYQLDEVATSSVIRKKIAQKFRDHAHMKDTRAISNLLVKGNEELSLIMNHFKQRHHLMAEYVDTMGKPDLIIKKSTDSLFLQQFYQSNYAQRKELLS